jgi:hypothetical protein
VVLDHPHDKAGEDEEGEAGEPEACAQWLHEDPDLLPRLTRSQSSMSK